MKGGRRGSIALGGLTPLLDTLFLLLFALLALSESRAGAPSEEVVVELPQVEADASSAPAAPRVSDALEIDTEGRVQHLPERALLRDREALEAALSAALGDGLPEEVAVELRADRLAPHGVAVEVLQVLRLAGFVDVRLLAEAAPAAGQPFGGGPR